MKIIPAVDIQNGKCVRLYKGQFDQETIMAEDPYKMAQTFKDEGAQWLHVIDLDGAKQGKMVNFEIIKKIKQETGLKLEVGGGIRDIDTVQSLLDLKIERIIVGTMAIDNPDMIFYLKNENIIVSVDAKKGKVLIKGWQKQTNVEAVEIIRKFKDKGITDFIYTDTERDGTMTSPNFTEIKKIRDTFPDIDLTIAGGIASIEDLEKLHKMKINWSIVGKAIYTNDKLRKYACDKNYTMS